MKKDGEHTGELREIGQDMELTRKERQEDLLELLYRWYRDGYPLKRDAVCREAKLSKRELGDLAKGMIRDGYIEPEDSGELFRLTEFGKAQGAECLSRHQNLTQFIQLICGVDGQAAEENACRIEHVISQEVAEGFAGFLKYGDQAERWVKNSNLRFQYAPGTYPCSMCLFEPEIRYPRRLAEEQEWFAETAELKIGQEKSYVWLRLLVPQEEIFWYFSEQGWREAVREKECLQIPTDVFRFMFFQKEPIGEGECLTAWTNPGEDCSVITRAHCRELNIHIW